MRQSGSTCHGAGRVMSRTAAIKSAKGRHNRSLRTGHLVRRSRKRDHEGGDANAYKDVSKVVEVVHNAGIAKWWQGSGQWGALKINTYYPPLLLPQGEGKS